MKAGPALFVGFVLLGLLRSFPWAILTIVGVIAATALLTWIVVEIAHILEGMAEDSWGVPKADKIDTNILRQSFSITQRSAIRRELRSIAKQFSDMPSREVRRALRYKLRDFARLHGVEPAVILQAINCSDVDQFIRE
jgi:hypothetical protein